jgi:hypothetical protein
MGDGEGLAQAVMECGGKRSATPLLGATGTEEKLRRRCALPEQSKTWRLALLLGFFILHSSFCLRAWGQSYSLDWYKISGGGGASTGATYQVTGTIGQPDAGSAMSGGQYSVTGGFWSLIAVVQTAGAPMLTIAHSGNSVTVSWPLGAGGFALQQNNNVANSAGWSPYGGTVNTTNSVSSITISPPTGNLFFRLSHP